VFQHTDRTSVEWQPRGDEMGRDIQQVPDNYAENVNFLRVINSGLLKVVEGSDTLQAALDRQAQAARDKRERAAQAAASAIDPAAKNDMIAIPCVGPSTNGRGECGSPVPVRERTKNERPPLCPVHEGMASQYAPTETEENGKPVVKWSRVQVGARQVQEAQ